MISSDAPGAYVTQVLNADASIEDWIRQLKAEVDEAGREAAEARRLGERLDKRLTDLEERLVTELYRVRAELEASRKSEAADTVPLATIGLRSCSPKQPPP